MFICDECYDTVTNEKNLPITQPTYGMQLPKKWTKHQERHLCEQCSCKIKLTEDKTDD